MEESDEDFSSDDLDFDDNWLPNDDPNSDTDSEHEDLNAVDAEILEGDEEEMLEETEESPTLIDTSDNVRWMEFSSRQKTFTFTGKSGFLIDVPSTISCLEAFYLFVDEEVIQLIVLETNRYAEQQIHRVPITRASRKKKWVPTNTTEIRKFLGLLLWMGLVKVGLLEDYWSKKNLYNFGIPARTMSRNRFQLLLNFIHFTDNTSIAAGDRIGKLKPLLDMLQTKFQRVIIPGENMVIDETVIPWRGRLVFRQYIPNKAHPYGIKLFKLCTTEGFTWSTKIYSGKSSTGVREVGLAKNVCEELSSLLKGEGRTLFVDNFYTSYELARSMLDQKTHVVGTLRANKKFCPKEVMNAQLKRGEMVAREEENGIVVLKWKDTRDVRMLSTKHAPVMAAVSDQSIPDPNIPSTSRGRRINRRQGNREKPLAIIEYNKGKSGIDLSDQMASYATTLRRGLKWYRKVAIEFLLGMAVEERLLHEPSQARPGQTKPYHQSHSDATTTPRWPPRRSGCIPTKKQNQTKPVTDGISLGTQSQFRSINGGNLLK
ncbi:piggyBac transposable element-derived protein 4-like [Eupeodes corollae]|uniref:piggyBac transposable element-derived protein 4-like n=1 Tax=Eupeodes corollae TaxID=290404 RepID=UPI0024929B1F|nr:piggyBac transposable element-derived protein 4-like [Eupeodes corollae]